MKNLGFPLNHSEDCKSASCVELANLDHLHSSLVPLKLEGVSPVFHGIQRFFLGVSQDRRQMVLLDGARVMTGIFSTHPRFQHSESQDDSKLVTHE